MKTIAIEEHFTTPLYKQKVPANEFRNFYLSSRSEQLGHKYVRRQRCAVPNAASFFRFRPS